MRSMPFIPQELVNSILDEVRDRESLNSCSLVGSMFRAPSQHIILQSITLSGWLKDTSESENYGAPHTLLEESPHVASYITALELRLNLPVVDPNNLEWVLRRTTAVARTARSSCEPLPSYPESGQGCSGSPPSELWLLSGIWYFIRRCYTLLAYPGFRHYISKLLRLAFNPEYGRTQTVVVPVAANTLEHIHFTCYPFYEIHALGRLVVEEYRKNREKWQLHRT
ncbi:hypothetical protein DFH08DRAFT_992745 [Mycena albidolilacea]|uniref:Uncharacterized protein n=1 Tax=Mycena albidolilacea TaxID=1033008 RepID=A0AAD7A7P5_9AGAR|nr:hypothetical protein DFH08DRAFT_992745 [Mycena albidolilacea]